MTTKRNSQNDLIILIPARNEANRIPFALKALNDSYLLPNQEMKVVVCANACTDNTLEVLEEMKQRHKNLDVVLEPVPGKPRALNALLDKSEKEFKMNNKDTVVLLDANAEVQPDTIAEIAWMLHSDDELSAVSANEISLPPVSQSFLDHLLFGISDLSVSAIAMRDRKSSCTAVKGNKIKGIRFPENVISDDLWLAMKLGGDSVETHPVAFTVKDRPKNLLAFTKQRIRNIMGLYQMEEFFEPHDVREEFPMGTHEHVQAFFTEPELQEQFAELPGVYKLANIVSVPVHAVLKTAAWVGLRLSPQPPNLSHPVTRVPKEARNPVQMPSPNV
jgi:cellulose synthase/poly-beta-1,6-N-acetylglucosamine synthase-like glycosyltransferase